MAEFFLELFSEEIPARMQANAAAELQNRLLTQLAALHPQNPQLWHGPRRLAFSAQIESATASLLEDVRGPRLSAPDAALDGFLRKNNATRADLVAEGEFHYLRRAIAPVDAATLIASAPFTASLASLPWPKSMRWGGSGAFTWVRPLRRITCLLDGAIVPIRLGPITASDHSEAHRFMAPGAFRVSSAAQWAAHLAQNYVVADAAERRALIESGLTAATAARGLHVVPDPDLLDEVTGLVEYPVILIGSIDPQHMTLPPEVRELSMKVNQRYFATRDQSGSPAPFFAFVANIEADDGGAAIIAGNERVLRARLADAEHFWTQDRLRPLDDYLPQLDRVVFHAQLGSQAERAARIATQAGAIAEALGADPVTIGQAIHAGALCKADLVTFMVGEFPELQGIMGGYYADDPAIGAAIRSHYQPKGPADAVPHGLLPCALALADKIDTLRAFFSIGEIPSGSGDPYALRRAALGIIRIILENSLRLALRTLIDNEAVFNFIIERLRVKLRAEGKSADLVNAILAAAFDDDLTRIQQRTDALSAFLASDDGTTLIGAYRRGANILRIENAKDGPHTGPVDPGLLTDASERDLDSALARCETLISDTWPAERYDAAMIGLATLREPIDRFFDQVTVNDADDSVRRNRLRMLARLRDVMHRVADFSKLGG